MSRTFKTIAAFALAATFAFPASAQDVLKLRLSSENPPGGNTVAILERFKEYIEEDLGDAVEVELFHSGALGDEAVHVQQIRTGQIDIHPTAAEAALLDPKWGIFEMPFLFADRDAVRAVLDGEIGAEMRASMRERAGIEVLGFGELGFRQMTNNVRPIVVPEDLSGLRIRIPGSPARVKMFETYGAVPVSLNFGELYMAMQQGAVDGQENPLISINSQSYQEVQKYLSLSNHIYTPITLTMNGRKYDSLTDEQRAAVQEAATKAVEWTRQNGQANDDRLRTELQSQIEMNEIDLAAFQAASKPVSDMIAETAGQEFIDQVLAAVGGGQ
jgi:TRAP-type transport system periplasmic protein